MSHLYFDQPTGFDFTREDIGLYLDGVEDAKAAADAVLGDLTRDRLPKLGAEVHSPARLSSILMSSVFEAGAA